LITPYTASAILGRERLGYWLDVVPGLVGIFGLGHFYMGYKTRAYHFLSLTAVLGGLVAWAFLAPNTVPPALIAPGMPAIWFLGWIAEIRDIRSITKEAISGKRVNSACPLLSSLFIYSPRGHTAAGRTASCQSNARGRT
jgi:hypothetical protein